MNKILLCDYIKLKTQECQNTTARCLPFYFFLVLFPVSFLSNHIFNVPKFQKEKSQLKVTSFYCGIYTAHRSSLGTKVNLQKLTGVQKLLSLHFAKPRTE